MIRREFQPSENRRCPQLAGFFVSAALLAVSAPALADETSVATAAFPLVASYTPTATAAFAPTPRYHAPQSAPLATPAARPPEAVDPNWGVAPNAPVDPSWGVPPSAPPPAPTVGPGGEGDGANPAPVRADATADRGGEGGREFGKGDERWMLALEGYTSVPVDVGGRFTFETPFRLRLSGAFGVVPGAYFGVVNNVVKKSGAYDAFGADVVEANLDDGTVWRAMIGFRPFAGLYVDAGYARIGLSGRLRADQFNYSIDTTLHMWTAEIGYQGQVADRLVLALGLGVMKTFAASSTVSADFELGRTASAVAVTDPAVAEYDHKLEQYGYVPTLTARVGWDFF
jgi:hypothetical protein